MAKSEDNGQPRGWASAKIVDLISPDGLFVDGDWVESKDQDPNGDVRLIQLADVGDGEYRDRSNRFMTSAKAKKLGCTFLEKDDILVARMPDPLGRSCLFPGDSKPSVTVVDVCIVRTGEHGVDHRWLMHTVNSPLFRADVASLQSGSTRKRISRGNLATLELPVPPLPEQHRIVAKVEELLTKLDAGVEALQAVKAQLKRYRQSVLKSAFEGKLTAAWREAHEGKLEPASVLLERIEWERKKKLGSKYKEAVPVDTSELPELPRQWGWASLGAVADMRLGKMLDKAKNKGEFEPYLRNINVRWGAFDLTDLAQMRFEKDDEERCGLQIGDLVVCEGGEPGRAAVWKHTSLPMKIQKALHRVRFEPTSVHPEYMCYYLYLRGHNGTLSKYFTGTTIKHFTGVKLAEFVFPIAPKEEQNEIVAQIDSCLSVTDSIEKSVDQGLTQSERLRQSILKRAFEGKLVPQDPKDEPAEKLLERIQAERVMKQEQRNVSSSVKLTASFTKKRPQAMSHKVPRTGLSRKR